MQRDEDAIREKYAKRRDLLQKLVSTLQMEVSTCLADMPHIDRISFRAKGISSFVTKANQRENDGTWKYAHPFEEIEDQVAGRVLVFYRSDVDKVMTALTEKLKKAEREHRKPASAKEFDYETTHMICVITPDLVPQGWPALVEPPETFELQVRTLAQHAWSEPQHEFYKQKGGLEPASLRKMYWAAASAWGLDSIWEDLRPELEKLTVGS